MSTKLVYCGYEFINTTPHDFNYLDANEDIVWYLDKAEADEILRASVREEDAFQLGDIKVFRPTYERDESQLGKFPYVSCRYYIVSRITAEAYPERKDFLIPNGLVRNPDGSFKGAKSLAVI